MKNKIIWLLIKAAFRRTGFRKAVEPMSNEEIEKAISEALIEENFELAAVLKYVIKFRGQSNFIKL